MLKTKEILDEKDKRLRLISEEVTFPLTKEDKELIDKMNKSKKEKLTLNKLQKRNEYLTNHFDIFHNIYFIVQINDKVFSHTVLYKYVLDKLKKHIQYINDYNIIGCLNAMLKYCMMKLTKKVLTSKKEI